MSGPGLADFNSRIARIEQARSHGMGFEAEGTLGRSFYAEAHARSAQKRRVFARRLLIVGLVAGLAVTSLVVHHQGPMAHQTRVALLMLGEDVDRIGVSLRQAVSFSGAAAP